jgi:hypothetical protein
MKLFLHLLILSVIASILIYGVLVDRGDKFKQCYIEGSDNVCDSCAFKFTPYLIVNDDYIIINLKYSEI